MQHDYLLEETKEPKVKIDGYSSTRDKSWKFASNSTLIIID